MKKIQIARAAAGAGLAPACCSRRQFSWCLLDRTSRQDRKGQPMLAARMSNKATSSHLRAFIGRFEIRAPESLEQISVSCGLAHGPVMRRVHLLLCGPVVGSRQGGTRARSGAAAESQQHQKQSGF
ncbi:hypothetical protein BKA81DRAFT_227728 [Phyllosticta paracitricarpa]